MGVRRHLPPLLFVADDVGQGNTCASTYVEEQQLHFLECLGRVHRVKVQGIIVTNLVGQGPLVLNLLLGLAGNVADMS